MNFSARDILDVWPKARHSLTQHVAALNTVGMTDRACELEMAITLAQAEFERIKQSVAPKSKTGL